MTIHAPSIGHLLTVPLGPEHKGGQAQVIEAKIVELQLGGPPWRLKRPCQLPLQRQALHVSETARHVSSLKRNRDLLAGFGDLELRVEFGTPGHFLFDKGRNI